MNGGVEGANGGANCGRQRSTRHGSGRLSLRTAASLALIFCFGLSVGRMVAPGGPAVSQGLDQSAFSPAPAPPRDCSSIRHVAVVGERHSGEDRGTPFITPACCSGTLPAWHWVTPSHHPPVCPPPPTFAAHHHQPCCPPPASPSCPPPPTSRSCLPPTPAQALTCCSSCCCTTWTQPPVLGSPPTSPGTSTSCRQALPAWPWAVRPAKRQLSSHQAL